MGHARTGPSTGSSPLVARTTLPSLHLPPPLRTSLLLACRSASIATVPVRVARGVCSTLDAGSFLTSSRTLTSCRYSLLRLLLVDVGRRLAGVDSLRDCRSRH